MYKSLCVATVLVAAFAFTSSSKSVATLPSSPTSPVIVARGTITNQTKPFETTIFTPTQDGLYRLSVYATVTTAGSSDNSYWTYLFGWTDATGMEQETQPMLKAPHSQLGQFSDIESGILNLEGGITRTFQASAGTRIVHQITASGPLDDSAYALYYVLERIQ